MSGILNRSVFSAMVPPRTSARARQSSFTVSEGRRVAKLSFTIVPKKGAPVRLQTGNEFSFPRYAQFKIITEF